MKKTKLTNEELCLAFQAGDRQAAEQLYLANYPFIRSIALAYARRYPGLWMDADDFTQEGAIALLRAAETYLPGTNATFLTYARRIIHNAIRDILRKALPHAEKETTHEPQEPTWDNYKKRCSSDASSYEHNPEWIYLHKENTQRIQAAVAKLSVRENAWISVRYGFSDDAPPVSCGGCASLSSDQTPRKEAGSIRPAQHQDRLHAEYSRLEVSP